MAVESEKGTWKLKNIDLFLLVNLVLFVFMCVFAYYDRFVFYRGSENILEFLVYAILILIVIFVVWYHLRKYAFSTWMFVLLQIAILMHFSGGLGSIGESRLYNHYFFSLRYDKYVHFVNSFLAALVIRHLFLKFGLQLKKIEGLVIILCVLGFGALFEIVEYLVTIMVPRNGVGGYNNNMQDLMANLTGGLFYLLFSKLRFLGRKPERDFREGI